MANKASVWLSEKLNTKVHIGNVDIQFIKKIVLEDVLIEDLHHDTLVYSKKLKLDLGNFDFKKHTIIFSDVVLINTKAKLVQYKSENDLNLQFIIDAFQSTDTTKNKTNIPWDIRFEEVTLVNSDFTYRDENDSTITTGINYFNLQAHSINSRITDIQFEKDTIHGTINYLSTVESSGFILQNFSSYVKVSPVGIRLDELRIKTPESSISTDLTFSYGRYSDFKDFIHRVKLQAEFSHSQLEMNDISYFAPELSGLYRNLNVSGKVSGTISDLRGKRMDINFGGVTHFLGDVTLTGLPNIDETLIYLNVERLTTNYNDLRQIPIPPFAKQQMLNIPSSIAKLGNMKFKGTFTGLYNDFYAYGDFSSALGELSTDLSVSHDLKKNKEFYKGKLKSKNFDIGELTGTGILGKVTANIDIDGSGLTLEDVAAHLRGTINSLDFNKYTYKNIAVEGNAARKIFNGKLNVKDDNVDFDFLGEIDFTQKIPALDFTATIRKADIGALHFLKTSQKTELSTHMVVKVVGDNIDNLMGQINIDNTVYRQDNETYKLNDFNLISKEENDKKSIVVVSDFLDAKISGIFKVLELPVSVEKLLGNYLPSYFHDIATTKNIPSQNFEYSFLFKNTDAATRLFIPKITIAKGTTLKGDFNSSTNHFSLTGNSEKLTFGDFTVKNWNVKAGTNGDLIFNSGCDRLFISDSTWLSDFKVTSETKNDSMNLALVWDNKSQGQYKGDIKAFLHVKPDKAVEFKILPSQFVFFDSVWSINKANLVVIDSNFITIDKLIFEHGDQYLSLNGIVSDNKNDQLKLTLNNFNLANLNFLTKSLNFRGHVDGESTITDVYKGIVFASDNSFKSFFLNGNEIGNGDIKSVWDNSKEALYLHGNFTLGIVPNILFSGYYYPKKEENNVDLELNLQAIQMQLFEPFVKEYCSDFKGFFAGNIKMEGSLKKPLLSGTVNVNAKKIKVNYLNTIYNFSHDIVIKNNSFGVENMPVYDINHNQAIITGKVYHDNFKNFQLDFDIAATKLMCLNTTEVDNSLYYGKAFVTGIADISGFTDNIIITANLRTDKITSSDKPEKLSVLSNTEMTKIYLPLSGPAEVGQNNFITFVKKDSSVKVKNDYKVQLGGLTLNFDLDMTPDAEVQLIFDQKVGDIIKARGDGNIKLNINSSGDFKMYGDYIISSGDYLFTLQNIINKKFDIEKGGTIKWSGIPYKADLNLSALYKARASLLPFLIDTLKKSSYSKRYPVDLKLLMTGDLLSPAINFDIGLPTVEPSIRQEVLSYVNTNDAETNRQVFSLLILNSFVTPYAIAGSIGGPTVRSTAGANSSELLSNQLSNMLSKISKDFDIGVNYRPGDAISNNELEVALSTQLFNDKLTVESNLGRNSNPDQNANNIVGDVNVEYKLTDEGKVRIKAFNKANDNNTIYSNGAYIQGVGIFYREEFDAVGELFRRYLAVVKKRKKEKSTEEK